MCGEYSEQTLCQACLQQLPYLEHACIRCAHALHADATQNICGDCLHQLPIFDYVHALCHHDYPFDRLIYAAKYSDDFTMLRTLATLLSKSVAEKPRPDVLIPIPMHPVAQRQRGYNQAVELARFVSQQLSIPLALDVCHCVRPKQSQAKLSKRARQQNVKGIFAVYPEHIKAHWRHAVIIDDVVTTGATVNECAKQLYAAGFEQVGVWCCARRSDFNLQAT